MSMLARSLMSHYRNHPAQAVFLLVGIATANVLLVGTQLINAQARASQAQGERLLQAQVVGELRAREASGTFAERHYVRLRLQGFDMLAPALGVTVRTRGGEVLELLGTDPLALPRSSTDPSPARFSFGERGFGTFLRAPYELWLAPARMRQLGWQEGARVELASGVLLPPAAALGDEALGHRMLMDIGALQVATGNGGRLSHVLVFDAPATRLQALRAELPAELQFVAAGEGPDPAALTRSFHLNLGAMGMLAFLVGVFLIYNALAFGYSDRRELIRRMRLAGAARAGLARALLVELGVFLAIGGAIGAWLGSRVAAWLLPGVGQTLAQLYDVHMAYPDRMLGPGVAAPLLMTVSAAALCAWLPMREALSGPVLGRSELPWRNRRMARRDRALLLAGIAGLAAAWIIAQAADGLWVALSGMALLLLGAALCLPAVLRGALALAGRIVPRSRPRLRWLVADGRWLLGPAATALMAMTLALVANLGLNTMIASFRQATDDWLVQRLAAQVYLRGEQDLPALRSWLASNAPGVKAVERFRTITVREAPSGGRASIEVVSLQDDARFLEAVRLIRSVPAAMEHFAAGRGVLVSERAWRMEGWTPGQRVALCPGRPRETVLGVYHDYGNPLAQWMTSHQLFLTCWPGVARTGVALVGPDSHDWASLQARLGSELGIAAADRMDQAQLRRAGLAVFERTFSVTDALNALTLLVAGIGVFCAVSAIQHHRAPGQALLATLGLARSQRAWMLFAQWATLGALCMLVVWPLGTALAAYLAGVVTPVAFGWSFPLVFQWRPGLTLAGLAVASLALAVAVPSLGLLRISPATLLREPTA